jgi:hypothetical protein
MPKQVSPRTAKRSNGSAARQRLNKPALGSNPGEGSLAITISQEALASRAYELFLARGGQHGDALADWLQAERELLQSQATGGTPAVR